MPQINQIQPVAGSVQAPTPMSLGDMVGLARGVQAYQQAEQLNPLAVQTAKETLTQSQVKSEQDVMALNQKKFKHIADSQISMINNPLVIAAEQNPNAVNKEELVKQITQNGVNTAKALGIPQGQAMELLQPYINVAQTNPAALRQYYKERHIQGLDEGARTTALGASGIGINTGAGGYSVQTGEFGPQRAGTVIPGTAYESKLGPGQIMEPTGRVDPAGNPTAYVKDANGRLLGEVTIPAGVGQPQIAPQGGQPAPQSNAPVRMPYETSETISAARAIQLKANEAAKGVQNSLYNNNKIIQLADKALVGAGAETLSKLGGGYAALPWTSDATQNRQILGHQMALETANLASAAGLGTDAARGLAEKMAGTTEWTPDAIKATARMNRALSTGIGLFNEGVNNTVKGAGNNPLAAREFQNRWTSQENLVPTLQFVDAVRNGDQAAIKQIVDGAGGYGSNGYKKLLIQADNLSKLVKGK